MVHVIWLQICVLTLFCILNVTLRVQGLGGQQGVVMDLGVRLVHMGLVQVKRSL